MHASLSIVRQCQLLGLSRSGYYNQPHGISELNLLLMRLIDREYTEHPFFGYRKMVWFLQQQGHPVNKKRVRRLMRLMGLAAMVPGPHTSRPAPQNPVFPYLLRGVKIDRVNQVWSCDITYIPMPKGFVYLFAVIRRAGHRFIDSLLHVRRWRPCSIRAGDAGPNRRHNIQQCNRRHHSFECLRRQRSWRCAGTRNINAGQHS